MRKLTELFSYEYSQPKEYHFSLDSIEMARSIAELWRPSAELDSLRVLDLCAGSGVVALELRHLRPGLQRLDFVEVQEIFIPHLERNLKIAGCDARRCKIYPNNYEILLDPEFSKTYDLIVCNPPYFRREQGKLPPDEIKLRAKFFIDSTFEKLIESIEHSLSPTGEAFILVRDLSDHGWDTLSDLRVLIRGKLFCEMVADIRGTLLLRLYRNQEQ